MVRDTEDGSGHFFHIKEGMTQVDALAMITYGIGFLPIIRYLRITYPLVTQPWYADDVGAGEDSGTSWNTSRT